MPNAFLAIRDEPVYRRAAFERGLRAVGYDVLGAHHAPTVREPGRDAYVIWNRYGAWHEAAQRFEAAGGVIIVAENAYCANDRADRRRYALAREGHNGSGTWPLGDGARWQRLGIALQPWRTSGTHVLVAPNRSFGMPGFIMPSGWDVAVRERLARLTSRPVRVRPHPGNVPARKPLVDDLRDAWAVVIWSSSVGVDALLAGIPVFCLAPWWICKWATSDDLKLINDPPLLDRLTSLERLAWAQWTIEEIEAGEPFQHLLQRAPAFAGRV